MAMELPRIEQEQNAYRNRILSSDDGKGIVFSGKYYHLTYESYSPNASTLKCEGVKLVIKRNIDNSDMDFNHEIVLFENEKIGLFGSLNGKVPVPFKTRFKAQCEKMIAIVTEFDDHNRKVEETANKVVKCKSNIDNLVSEITGGKSVSYVRMLTDSENTQKALVESTTHLFMEDTNAAPVSPKESAKEPKRIKLIQPEIENNAWKSIPVMSPLPTSDPAGKAANDCILNSKGIILNADYTPINEQ